MEVKTLGASRDTLQLAKDAAMATEGGQIGKAAGGTVTALTGQTLQLKTIELRPF